MEAAGLLFDSLEFQNQSVVNVVTLGDIIIYDVCQQLSEDEWEAAGSAASWGTDPTFDPCGPIVPKTR